MRRIAPVALLALLLAGPAGAVKMMYACSGAGGGTSIQDHPCDAARTQQSYATPDSSAAAPVTRGNGTMKAPAKARIVDFTVACRSLDEERLAVIDGITTSTAPRQTQRLQARLKRISQAQCTARCGPC
jgi:hypothetical protein